MKFNFTRKKLAIAIVFILVVTVGAVVFFAARKGPKNLSLNLNSEKSSSQFAENGQSTNTNYGLDNNSVPTEEITDEEGEKTVVNVDNLDPNKNKSSDSREFAHITTEHCSTDCQAFANNLQYLEYCQQVCGLAPEKKVSNCDGKKDLEKDYCLKDLAIGKKDSSICGEISDANIKKTCKDRILEDILEGQ